MCFNSCVYHCVHSWHNCWLYCSTGITAAIWVKSQTRRQCECTLFCVLRPTVIGGPCSAVQPVVLKCSSIVHVILTVAWVHQFHSMDYDFCSYLISTFFHTFLLGEKFYSLEKLFIPWKKVFLHRKCLFLGENICSSEKTCIPLRRFKKKLSWGQIGSRSSELSLLFKILI